MKKIFALILVLALAIPATAADYPTRNVTGVVLWGAGGTTDSLIRPLSAVAEQYLGKSIIIQNMTGAAGSVATQYVYDASADGYTLLMGAENPALYDVLGISDVTYDQFDCVYLIGDEAVGVIVGKNSPYKSFTEVINAAKEKPFTLKYSMTGKGGLPWVVGSFIMDVTGAQFNMIPYDSDSAAKNAVVNGECDFTACLLLQGIEEAKAGDVKFLSVLAKEPARALPEIPLITAEFPGFNKYLPWGAFYGVFAKKGTDPAIIATLADAFTKAGPDENYQKVLVNFDVNFMGLTGEKAAEYISSWRKNTVEALKSSGALDD